LVSRELGGFEDFSHRGMRTTDTDASRISATDTEVTYTVEKSPSECYTDKGNTIAG